MKYYHSWGWELKWHQFPSLHVLGLIVFHDRLKKKKNVYSSSFKCFMHKNWWRWGWPNTYVWCHHFIRQGCCNKKNKVQKNQLNSSSFVWIHMDTVNSERFTRGDQRALRCCWRAETSSRPQGLQVICWNQKKGRWESCGGDRREQPVTFRSPAPTHAMNKSLSWSGRWWSLSRHLDCLTLWVNDSETQKALRWVTHMNSSQYKESNCPLLLQRTEAVAARSDPEQTIVVIQHLYHCFVAQKGPPLVSQFVAWHQEQKIGKHFVLSQLMCSLPWEDIWWRTP